MTRFALIALLLPVAAFAQAPEGRVYTPGAFDAIEVSGAAAVRFVQAAVLDASESSRRPGEVLGVDGRRVAFATARGSLLAVASEAPRLRRGDLLRAEGLS